MIQRLAGEMMFDRCDAGSIASTEANEQEKDAGSERGREQQWEDLAGGQELIQKGDAAPPMLL